MNSATKRLGFRARLCFLMCASAAISWANTNPCAGSYTFATLETNGCEQIDKIFSAFSDYVNNGKVPPTSNIMVTFSGAGPAGPITDTFSATGWVNTTDTGSIFLYDYTQVDGVSNPGYVITGFDLNPASITFPGTCAPGPFCDGVQIITTICTNLNTNTCKSTDANYGQINFSASATNASSSSFCYATCSGGSSLGSSISIDPSLGVTSIFVTNWIILNNYDGNAVTFNGFANDYFEQFYSGAAPEPGTLLLLGAGLGLAGILKLRRR